VGEHAVGDSGSIFTSVGVSAPSTSSLVVASVASLDFLAVIGARQSLEASGVGIGLASSAISAP